MNIAAPIKNIDNKIVIKPDKYASRNPIISTSGESRLNSPLTLKDENFEKYKLLEKTNSKTLIPRDCPIAQTVSIIPVESPRLSGETNMIESLLFDGKNTAKPMETRKRKVIIQMMPDVWTIRRKNMHEINRIIKATKPTLSGLKRSLKNPEKGAKKV